MNNIIFDSIVIEVTRRCNMSCPHCLRGDAQNVDIDLYILDKFLNNFKDCYIRRIIFTGGEPSLNPEALQTTLDLVKKYNIITQCFIMITNGRNFSDKVIGIMNSVDNFGALLSQDRWHDKLTDYDFLQLSKLKHLVSKQFDVQDSDLLKMGRSSIGKEKNYEGLIFAQYHNNLVLTSELVCTCYGDVLDCCDYNFDDMDTLCSIRLCEYDDDILSILRDEANDSPIYNLVEIRHRGSEMFKFFEYLTRNGIAI